MDNNHFRRHTTAVGVSGFFNDMHTRTAQLEEILNRFLAPEVMIFGTNLFFDERNIVEDQTIINQPS